MHLRSWVTVTALLFVASASVAPAARAQMPGNALQTLLANASDAALDRLSRPGAFSSDAAIRIGLPGASGKLGDVLQLSDKVGATNDLSGQLNHAAEAAAGQVKPIFRSAIDRITMRDAVGIGTRGNTAATDFLKRTSRNEIVDKIGPIVRNALSAAGAFRRSAALSALGLNNDRLTDYVAQKTADGIFTYMGREETRMRSDPTMTGRSLLKGLKY